MFVQQLKVAIHGNLPARLGRPQGAPLQTLCNTVSVGAPLVGAQAARDDTVWKKS